MQIIVESFPVSSSGHCFLITQLIKQFPNLVCNASNGVAFSDSFLQSFDHALHFATIAVLALFFFDRWKLFFIRPRLLMQPFFKLVLFVGAADVVTALLYLLFKLHPVQFSVAIGFCVTGVSLLSLYWITVCPCLSFDIFLHSQKHFPLRLSTPSGLASYGGQAGRSPSPVLPEPCRRGNGVFSFFTKALILGLVQGIALLPGISRLATTYVAARWLGLSPRKAFEVSWLIAVPLFAAAGLYAGWKLYHMPVYYPVLLDSLPYIVGLAIIAYGALCFTAYLFYTKRAWWFGVYMMIPIVLTTLLYII